MAKAKKVVKKRAYNSELRTKKVAEAHLKIIESLVELLVERRGGEVQMDEVAQHSGFSERTIFRFFKDKASLHQATNDYLQSFFQESFSQIEARDVAGFAKHAFELFDKHENLTAAYIHSQFGRQARLLFRKKLNQMIFARIIEEQKLTLNPELKLKLAMISTLINAKIWDDLKTDFGYSGAEMGEAVEWAIKTLISGLRRS